MHPDSQNPTKPKNQNIGEIAAKFEQIVIRQKIAKLANVLLSGPAEKYGDPNIRLSPSQEADINACVSELMADQSESSLQKIAPYLPWLGLAVIVGPIIIEKYELIKAHSANAVTERPANAPKSGGKLTRADIQPDNAGAGEE